jgi:hypothetical protein
MGQEDTGQEDAAGDIFLSLIFLTALSEFSYPLGREAGQAAEEGGDFLAQGVRERKA